jgi:hypothetical protein
MLESKGLQGSSSIELDRGAGIFSTSSLGLQEDRLFNKKIKKLKKYKNCLILVDGILYSIGK